MNNLASVVVPIILFAFLIYRRIRRTIGPQRLVRRSLIVRTSILSALGLIVIGLGVLHPIAYLGDGIGIAAGGLLAYAAVRSLSFERRAGQWYYRTRVWVETLVLVLFLGRLVLDFLLRFNTGGHRQGAAQFEDPVTVGVLEMFLCYYVAFAATLLHKERTLSDGGATQPA